MPRIIDRLDAAVGRTPDQLEDTIDYLTQQLPPARIIASDGTYVPGWFAGPPGELNFTESSAFEMAFHKFFHCTIDTPDHYIVFNIADFSRATNRAILVVDKRTQTFTNRSLTHRLQRDVSVDAGHRRFHDQATNSFLVIDEQEHEIRFSIHAGELHLSGVAHCAVGPAMIQCTQFHRGRGSLQWYGCLELQHGTLTVGEEVIALPPGTFGTYDRTMGHQRGLQGWNWIAFVSQAVRERDGKRCPVGVQIVRDILGRAKPAVLSRKYVVWLDGQVRKLPDAEFDYDRTEGSATDWHIHTPSTEGDWIDLVFDPRFERRDEQHAALVEADFKQFYGPVTGTLSLDGERWTIEEAFAVTEDSLLEL